ncbi:MAG: hypothetical protein RI956_1029 [Pseudomonadota bacterium]|jgi:hypothetical protein
MKHTKKILAIIGLSTIAIQTAFAQSTYTRVLSTTDKVVGYAKHIKLNNIKRIEYSFNITNNSPYTIYGVEIGQKSVIDNEPAIDFGDDDSRYFIYKSPIANWLGSASWLPETYNFSFNWIAPSVPETYNEVEFLLANKAHTGFSVTTFKRYPTIWSTFVELKSTNTLNERIVQLTKGDTTAPTGSLAATLVKHPTKTGFYNINLKVTAKDNYDPLPEIMFTSVQDMTTGTKNTSPFNAGAYTVNTPNDPVTGAYPSVITFAADANVAKQYKINYTVTDASDNKTELSTTVTVPKR